MTDPIRQLQKIDARLSALKVTAADRPAARRTMLADAQATEAEGVAARTAKAEADVERARIAAVVRAGQDISRPRQAVRLALSGPITAVQAKAILSILPTDAKADPMHLTLDHQAGTWGSATAQAERARLITVFSHPLAAERFNSASALALDGDASAATVLAMLAGLPPEAARPTILSIAERAAGAAEFGGSPTAMGGESSRKMWSRAIRQANESIGAAPVARPGPTGAAR